MGSVSVGGLVLPRRAISVVAAGARHADVSVWAPEAAPIVVGRSAAYPGPFYTSLCLHHPTTSQRSRPRCRRHTRIRRGRKAGREPLLHSQLIVVSDSEGCLC
uniref:Uncharacterized protein n=1 Tax=Panagrellus redivivus TaxID=6233 RepID=A0A7E4W2D2_PANRE